MSVPDPEFIAKLLADSRDGAAAFVEDMDHIREILARPPPGPARGDMRRLSASLRRLIVESDLQRIATPRIGRIRLEAPDMKSLVKTDIQMMVDLGGTVMSAYASEKYALSQMQIDKHNETRVLLSVDSFGTQPILCFQGVWIRRQAVIKYVANMLSGVHSNSGDQSQEEQLLGVVRTSLSRRVGEDKNITVQINRSMFLNVPEPVNYDPNLLDPTLLQLLTTSKLIAHSADVVTLEAEVRNELGLTPL